MMAAVPESPDDVECPHELSGTQCERCAGSVYLYDVKFRDQKLPTVASQSGSLLAYPVNG